MLCTSLGKVGDKGYSAIYKTSFGADTSDKSSFFTGKPYVGDLGYTFLLRNYRADVGKWLTADLLGYPDGWNNFAYCNNASTSTFDLYGAAAFLNYDPASASSGKILEVTIRIRYTDLNGNQTFQYIEKNNYNIVLAHGLSEDTNGIKKGTPMDLTKKPFSADTLSNNIKNASGYDSTLPVLLLTCYAGESFALDLSKTIGIPVFASPNYIPIDFAFDYGDKIAYIITIDMLKKYE